jgi:hypothetical protein
MDVRNGVLEYGSSDFMFHFSGEFSSSVLTQSGYAQLKGHFLFSLNIFTIVGEAMKSDWCVHGRWTYNMKSDDRQWEQGDGKR